MAVMRVDQANGGVAGGFLAGSRSCDTAEVRQEPAQTRCGLVADELRIGFLYFQIALILFNHRINFGNRLSLEYKS